MQSRVMLWQMRLGAAALLLWSVAARAEPIPSEYLEVERQSCNQSCTGAGSPAAWCKRYCDCSIGRMKAEIPFAQYSQVGAAAVADAPQPPGLTDKLAAIAAACAKQTQ
jgi:hypothetical protein